MMSREHNRKFHRIYNWQSGCCLDCGKMYSETDLTRHHLLPVGHSDRAICQNIVLLCVDCHNKRHATPNNKYS